MKKRTVIFTMVIAMTVGLSICGCGDKTTSNTRTTNDNTTKNTINDAIENTTNPLEGCNDRELVKAILDSSSLLEQITILGGPDEKPYDGVNQPFELLYSKCPEYKELWDRGNANEAFLEYGLVLLENNETSTNINSIEFQKVACTTILEKFYSDIEIESYVDESGEYHFSVNEEVGTTKE